MNNKRYYWLKLEESYFDLKVQKAIRRLPSGAEMLICYLKMQLKYLNKGGLIEYQGIYDDISEEISLDIDEDINLVKATLGVLIKWKVIEETDNSNLYITEMQNRIGSKSDSAVRVAKFREKQKMLQCNTDVKKSNSIQEIDIEKEKDIEIELEQELDYGNNTIYDFIETNFGRTLNAIEYELIDTWEDNELTRYAIKQSVLNNKYNIKYIDSILTRYRLDNILTVAQAQESENNFKNKFKQKSEPKLSYSEQKQKREEEAYKEFLRQLEEENK